MPCYYNKNQNQTFLDRRSFFRLTLLISLVITFTEKLDTLSFPPPNEEISQPVQSSTSSFIEETQCCNKSHTEGLFWIDPKQPVRACLLCIHGMGLCAQAYHDFGIKMAQYGIATYAIDVEGFGPRRRQNSRLDLDHTVSDVKDVIKTIRSKNPNKPVFLLGESMGGSIVIRVASLYPESIDGLICSAPAWHIYKKKRTTLNGLITLIIHKNSAPKRIATQVVKQATTNPDLQKHWLTDEKHKLDLSPKDALSFLHFIAHTPTNALLIDKLPVLIIVGLHDNLVKQSGAAVLFHDMPTNNKTFVIDAAAEHLIYEENQFSSADINELQTWIEKNMNQETDKPVQMLKESSVLLNSATMKKQDEHKAHSLFSKAGINNRH